MIEPRIIENDLVRLEPMTFKSAGDHAAELFDIAGPPGELDLFSNRPDPWTASGFAAFIAWQLKLPATQPYLIRGKQHNLAAVGTSSFLDIRPAHRGVEIGWTWYGPAFRGTAVNPASKLAMLSRCFETSLFEPSQRYETQIPAAPAARVAFKTDLRNTRSQRAIEKLGATREGVLRDHVITHANYTRSTVMYSVLAREWPAIKHGLEARLR